MPETEFQQFQNYAARKMLPHRRVEMYLAQIALLIAKTMGGRADAVLSDYLFDPVEQEAASTEDAKVFFAFNPRKKASE